MLNYNDFKLAKSLRELGLSHTKIAEKFKCNRQLISKIIDLSEEEYYRLNVDKAKTMDCYREYILSVLKVCPQIKETNILYKLKENFPDFEVPGRVYFYRYMKKLREQEGYEIYKSREKMRIVRTNTEPGYEAQIDFGQYNIKDMYGKTKKIYFFCMLLSYSGLKFVYFLSKPFTTLAAIDAHKYAFKFFGGRPQMIVYDQDRLFVVNENLGDIIFVKEFENYVKDAGYSIFLCHGKDPQTKGKIESFVGYVKSNFLNGRIYCGIDSLNSSCIEWLDNSCNSIARNKNGLCSRELFKEESKNLVKIPYSISDMQTDVYSVQDCNMVIYKNNKYTLPKGRCPLGAKVRITEQDNIINIRLLETEEFICNHEIPEGKGNVVIFNTDEKDNPMIAVNLLKNAFNNDDNVVWFVDKLIREKPRYAGLQCAKIIKMTRTYSINQLLDGFIYCKRKDKAMVSVLIPYMMYRYGEDLSKKYLYQSLRHYYRETVKNIMEEENG